MYIKSNLKVLIIAMLCCVANLHAASTENQLFEQIVQKAGDKSNPTILVVSGWQDVNIGDIAHTPGLLHVLETFIPNATIILWKRSDDPKVKAMLNKNFPKVKILYGAVNEDKTVNNPEIKEAFEKADLMIHGSGPDLVGRYNLAAWIKHSDKPFGIFALTLQSPDAFDQSILKKASFIYTRETESIKHLKKVGIAGNHIKFVPDATFFMNIQDKEKADKFLKANKLEHKKFICVIPRLRYTPYHKFAANNNWSKEKIEQVEQTNEKFKEVDHAKLREAIIAWVRTTKQKVVVCPEMTYQLDIMDELVIDPLPDDVKPFVLKRGYWFPDEAASFYAKAFAVMSLECHSPIIAAVNGTHFFYLRQPEDTIKGQMYYDLGFNNSVFEIDATTGKQVADALMAIWKKQKNAKSIIKKNAMKIRSIYKTSCNEIMQLL